MSLTEILVKNPKTGSTEVKSMFLPVPAYELGTTIGYFLNIEDQTHTEGIITGFSIEVMEMGGDIVTQIQYIIDDGITLLEEEIDYCYVPEE